MSNKPKTLRLNKWGTVFSKLIAKKYAIYNLHVKHNERQPRSKDLYTFILIT